MLRRPNPRHRIEGFQKKLIVPETECERSLYVILHKPEGLNEVCPLRPWSENTLLEPSVEYPWQIYNNDTVRSVLEAFLLASEQDFPVSDALGMPIDEVNIYRMLFFDTKVFRTQLERIVFMQEIPDDHPYRKLYEIAMRQGVAALRWHFCQDKGEVQPENVLKTIMTDAYFRSLEHRGQIPTTKLAREAAKYAKLSMECARALIQKSETVDETTESLKLKFEEVRRNRTIDDLHREVGAERVVH